MTPLTILSTCPHRVRRRSCFGKNWLFAGSFEGARRAALLYSLVQSCKLVDVPPFIYLKDVLLRVAPSTAHSSIDAQRVGRCVLAAHRGIAISLSSRGASRCQDVLHRTLTF